MATFKADELTFNDVPRVMAYLVEKIDRLETLLESTSPAPVKTDAQKWLDIKELKEYLPDHPAPTTVYGWVRNNLIPYYKKGKKLAFKKSEIDEWLNASRQMTDEEAEAAALDYVNQRRIGK